MIIRKVHMRSGTYGEGILEEPILAGGLINNNWYCRNMGSTDIADLIEWGPLRSVYEGLTEMMWQRHSGVERCCGLSIVNSQGCRV